MAITPIPQNTPLTQLRAQGVDAVFSRCRVCVFPRIKVTSAIADELNLEAYYTKNNDPLGYLADMSRNLKLANGCWIWGWNADHATRIALGGQAVDSRDNIPDSMNGALYQQ